MKKTKPVSRSGRFACGPEAAVIQFTESVSFDWRLWRQDLQGSLAHARMLHRVNLLTQEEADAIVQGLMTIGQEIESGVFRWNPDLEDVHMNIEAELTRRVPAGARLHTGRSRNDQVALDMRLWVREEIRQLQEELLDLQRALVDQAGRYATTLVPGYTHLQRAQPVVVAHHFLAYVEMFERDRERLQDAARRVNVCPLGCGALAGSTLPLDRQAVAESLGFVDAKGRPRVAQNSMDAVSDRDFAVEFVSIAALAGIHLSRLAEDLILWASAEFGFIRIDDAYTTGSSLMPQKKNPDIAELARGKAARLIGDLTTLLVLLKGLPLTYNRDLQEDKEPLFDAADTIRASVRIMAAMMRHLTVNTSACHQAASDPMLLATDLAEHLVRQGLPFRQAHQAVGAAVALAEQLDKPLNQLSLEEFKSVHTAFGHDTLLVFDLHRAMDRKELIGAPGRQQVARQLRRWRHQLKVPLPDKNAPSPAPPK